MSSKIPPVFCKRCFDLGLYASCEHSVPIFTFAGLSHVTIPHSLSAAVKSAVSHLTDISFGGFYLRICLFPGDIWSWPINQHTPEELSDLATRCRVLTETHWQRLNSPAANQPHYRPILIDQMHQICQKYHSIASTHHFIPNEPAVLCKQKCVFFP